MCGRFALTSSLNEIKTKFGVTNNVMLQPRYNIAPSQPVLIIKPDKLLDFAMWGFKPYWMQNNEKYKSHSGFINARLETASEKPSFKQALKYKRCIILANGYYEWKLINTIKQPFYVSADSDEIQAFAGFYDGDTCCIVTVAASDSLKNLHDRMPLILNPDDYETWLSATPIRDTKLKKITENQIKNLNIKKVSTLINNPKTDEVACIDAIL